MDERSLLLLGILMTQSLHGYQINEIIEKNLRGVTDMKKATAYAILERLCQAGYVDSHTEQEGNRPPRKVFSITESGQQQFWLLLRQNLSQADKMTFPGDVGFLFYDQLPTAEFILCLQKRLAQLEQNLQHTQASFAHGLGQGVDLAIEHNIMLMRAEREWLIEVIGRYSQHT